MSSTAIMERFVEGRLLFDGGMGSMLIGLGLPAGWPPEEWNVSHPDAVTGVHRAYLQAGAEVVETNTFGATPGRLATHGFADRVAEFNTEGVRRTREAIAQSERRGRDAIAHVGRGVPEAIAQDEHRGREAIAQDDNATGRRFVALSMGPGGEMLPPVGAADPGRVRTEFVEQLRAVAERDVPDLILIETMIDLREALIALDVAKHTVDVPVAVSLTCNRNPRGFFTVMGDEVAAAAKQLEAAGVDVIAANCSISSRDMLDLAFVLRDATTLPLLCQPNAGNPGMRDGMPVYQQAPEEFTEHALALLDAGVNAVGGCCGTTPEFIRHLSDAIGSGQGGGRA